MKLINYKTLNKNTEKVLSFLDKILILLNEDLNSDKTLEQIKDKVEALDLPKNLKGLDRIAHTVFSKKHGDALSLLISEGYVKEVDNKYSLTLKGFSVLSSGGLVAKEKSEITKYNYQNIFWAVTILFLILNFLISLTKLICCS